jgi:hypothetical protein
MQRNPNKRERPNKRRRDASRHLEIAVVVVVAAASLALALLWAFDLIQPDSFEREVAKILVQLIGIVLVTGVISAAVAEYQKERDRAADLQQRKDNLLRTMLDETIAAYHDVKQTRRLMRARMWENSGDPIGVDIYDQHLAAINDAQLEFERLARYPNLIEDVRINNTQLKDSLDLIEQSLMNVVNEYERERRNVAGGSVLLEDLPELVGFMRKRDKMDETGRGWFHDGVAVPVNSVLTCFQQALLSSPSG